MPMSPLDPSIIRASAPAELAQYLGKVRVKSSDQDITQGLLQAVECGSIPPSVYTVWLGISRSPAVVKEAWKQRFSVQIRQSGIRVLPKLLRSAQWSETWECFGGTRGLLDLFCDFSVHEIQNVCLAISSSTKGADLETKREKVTELLKALLPRIFPDVPHRNPDPRPLFKLYQHLVPGCTTGLVADILNHAVEGEWDHFRNHHLFRSHSDTLRNHALQTISNDQVEGRQWLISLAKKHPSAPGVFPRFSASMQFSLEVLRRLVNDESSTISETDFLEDLVEPLAKRAIRKKIQWARTHEIICLTVQYLNQHRIAAKKIVLDNGRLLHIVAICWSRRSEIFEKPFRALLLLWKNEQSGKCISISELQVLFTGVAKSRRYALLRFCYKTLTERDIDNEGDLKEAQCVLMPHLLEGLPPAEALGLFTGLRNAKGDHNLISRGPSSTSITGLTSTHDGSTGDPDIFLLVLMQRYADVEKTEGRIAEAGKIVAEAEQLAMRRVQEGKKKATSSSDQSERAYYAHSVLCYAMASGSLQLYKETQEWARRFSRDPLTAKALHAHYADEARVFLCGIPRSLTKDDNFLAISNCVEEANKILLGLFETVRSTLREPSFTLNHWSGVLRLFFQVVEERIERSSALKAKLNLSENEVYDIVWKDTLSLLITVEEEGLKSGFERLEVNTVRGIFHYAPREQRELKNAEPSTYRFLDDLARARDQQWCKFRPTVYPNAATLPDPFPRGLPIQYLTGPYLISNPSLVSYAPYLNGRANAAVFLSPTAALTRLPPDKDTCTAIGKFIDDYNLALRMLVPKAPENEAKEWVKRAHAHLVGPLSEPRMSRAEALRYCQFSYTDDMVAKLWFEISNSNLVTEKWSPVFPTVDDPTKIEEWNPVPSQKERIKARSLEVTYIDLSINMQAGFRDPTIHSDLVQCKPKIPGLNPTQVCIWSSWETASEAGILAALLYLDTQNSGTSRMLTSPFPSPKDVRYPSIYLDEQFLSSRTDSSHWQNAIEYLKSHINFAPPTLVLQLAENSMNALDHANPGKSSFIGLETNAFLLIDVLSKSDQPSLAIELIVRTIIQRPEASSWHRRLLCTTFLRRLSASDAQSCFQKLAESIITRLEKQEKSKDAVMTNAVMTKPERPAKTNEVPNPSKDKAQQPCVKVTTVKFLAKLLQNPEFVSEDLCFSVLSALSQNASHMDIRKAVLDSLLQKLPSSPAEQSEKIFAVLESLTPYGSNLNERRPITTSEWEKAEESHDLPEVEPSFSHASSPILYALFNFYSRDHTNVEHDEIYMKRIILPIIERLKQETTRWTSLFLYKHGIDAEAQNELTISSVPRSLGIWTRLLHLKSPYLPYSYVKEYVDHIIFNISPPASIIELNNKLKNDRNLRSQPSVQYWLSLYDTGPHIISEFPLTSLFPQKSSLTTENGISTKQVQELFLRQFTVLLWNDVPRYALVNQLIQRNLRPVRFDEAWLVGQKPIVEAIIMYVETLRTRDWERSPKRQPSVLPNTFYLRLWLLKYPQSDHVSEETNLPLPTGQEAACKVLADQLAKTVDQICGRLYHANFEQLKTVVKAYLSGMHRVVVGCYLGDIEKTRLSWLTRPDELRIELAAFLLEGGPIKNGEGKKRAEKMLESWQRSESEEVRRLGLTTRWE